MRVILTVTFLFTSFGYTTSVFTASIQKGDVRNEVNTIGSTTSAGDVELKKTVEKTDEEGVYKVTLTAKDAPYGYRLVGNDTQEVKIDAEDKVIKVYYESVSKGNVTPPKTGINNASYLSITCIIGMIALSLCKKKQET